MSRRSAAHIPTLLIAAVFVFGYSLFSEPQPVASQATTKVIFLTSGSSWTVPADWSSSNSIEVIGGGGGGGSGGSVNYAGGGGGGGAYSKVTNVTLTPGISVTYAIGTGGGAAGAAGGDTYFCNSTSNCTSISGSAVAVGAKGGTGGSTGSAGSGGAAASGVGTVKRSGGAGGGINTSSTAGGGGGGAGAGGPSGNGASGGTGAAGPGGGGGGGGADNGSIGSNGTGSSGGSGGSGNGGTGGGSTGGGNGSNGGGGGGGNAGSPGTMGGIGGAQTLWTQTSPSLTAGAGGGGGGGGGASMALQPGRAGGAGATYGAGGGGGGDDLIVGYQGSGGPGAQGIIVITYTPYVEPPCSSTPTSSNVRGWAWSGTIGWISLSSADQGTCTNEAYGLNIAQSGTISGKIWSEHVGWISADAADLSGCPTSPCTARMEGSSMQGWMKALAATQVEAAWDGWISLSGTSPAYGPTIALDGTISGYMWGDTNLGWIAFDTAFSSATTTWVACAPSYQCTSETTRDNLCTTDIVEAEFCDAGLICATGGACVIPPAPTPDGTAGNLKAAPQLILPGRTTTISWDIQYATTCSIAEDNPNINDAWSEVSGSETTSSISQQTTYTLTCEGAGGTLTQRATVYQTPNWKEL